MSTMFTQNKIQELNVIVKIKFVVEHKESITEIKLTNSIHGQARIECFTDLFLSACNLIDIIPGIATLSLEPSSIKIIE